MASNLILRVISSIGLFLILGSVLYVGSYAVYTFMLVITILAYDEWTRMTKNQYKIIQILGIFTVILPNSSIMYVYISNQPVFFWLLMTVVFNDMFAYIIGKMIGGYRLLPSISPGKTWSGFLGGITAALLAGGTFTIFAGLPINFTFLSGIIAILATLGDLFESGIKRICKVKDSGRIIPGHGGILDRLDSFIFTAPFTIYLIS